MLKIGYLVPVTVIKALPDRNSYLMLVTGTEVMALLPKKYAARTLRVGDNTIASVFSLDGKHVFLSQRSSPFYRKLTELLISPLIIAGKVTVKRAAAVVGGGFAKVAVAGLNGVEPIAESIPLIKQARQYIDDTITLVRYSDDVREYIVNAFVPAPAESVKEVIHLRILGEAHVYVRPESLGLFIGKGGANVATVSKLTGVRTMVQPGY